MAKSRFFTVGNDNSDQFEPLKMSFMVKKIINSIDLTACKDPEDFFVGKERVIMVEGINLKISLTKEGFDDIKNKNLVKPENS